MQSGGREAQKVMDALIGDRVGVMSGQAMHAGLPAWKGMISQGRPTVPQLRTVTAWPYAAL